MKHKKSLLTTLLISLSLVACNGGGGSGNGGNGGSGSGGNGSGNGGGSTTTTITKLQVLSSTADSKYSNTCIFNDGTTTTIINGDGSGNGYSLNINNGAINTVMNLPQINIINDVCLDNFMELTWYNKSDKTTLNVFIPKATGNISKSINLNGTGLFGSDMDRASFNVFTDGSGIIANNSFQLLPNFQFSSLIMNNFNPTGVFSGIDNSQYLRSNSLKLLYGFDGNGDTATQILNTDGNLPSILVSYQPTSTGSGITKVRKIIDSNGNTIPQMSGGWDYATTGNGLVIVSGLVQPEVYNCPAKIEQDSSFNYVCGAPKVNTDLLHKYKMMRVLGATPTTLYFMGMDLANQQIAIFSMSI